MKSLRAERDAAQNKMARALVSAQRARAERDAALAMNKRLNKECQTSAEKGVAWLNQLLTARSEADALRELLMAARSGLKPWAAKKLDEELARLAPAPAHCFPHTIQRIGGAGGDCRCGDPDDFPCHKPAPAPAPKCAFPTTPPCQLTDPHNHKVGVMFYNHPPASEDV